MILLYDVRDGMWESKGNFQMAMEDNDEIIIQPTNDGKYNLDILCVSFVFYLHFFIWILKNLVFLQSHDISICCPPSCCSSLHAFTSGRSSFHSHCFWF